jgi:hypothetical protein
MPPELRKRKAPAVEPTAAPPAKKKGPVAKAVAKVKEVVTGSPKAAKTNGSSSASKIAVGETISLEGFGGEIETNDGVKTTLKKLVDESTAGVVLFTYPKASTPGCKYLLALPYFFVIFKTCVLFSHTNFHQALLKHATSEIHMPISPLLVSPSMVSQKTRQKPTLPSRRSRSFLIIFSAIPARLSSLLSV